MRKPSNLVGKQNNFQVAYGIWKSSMKQELKPKTSKPKVLKILSSKSLSLSKNKREKCTDVPDVPWKMETFREALKQKRQRTKEKEHYEHSISPKGITKTAEPKCRYEKKIKVKLDGKIGKDGDKEDVSEKKMKEIIKKYLVDPKNAIKPNRAQSDAPVDRFNRIRSLPTAFYRDVKIAPVHTKPSYEWRRVGSAKQDLKLQYSKYSQDEEKIARELYRELPILPLPCKQESSSMQVFFTGGYNTNQVPRNDTPNRYTFKALDIDNYYGNSKRVLKTKSNYTCKVRTDPAAFHYTYNKSDTNRTRKNDDTKRYAFKALDVGRDTHRNFYSTTPVMTRTENEKKLNMNSKRHEENWKNLIGRIKCLDENRLNNVNRCMNNVPAKQCHMCPFEKQPHRKIFPGDICGDKEDRTTTIATRNSRKSRSRGKSWDNECEYCRCGKANHDSPKNYAHVHAREQRLHSRQTEYNNRNILNRKGEQLLLNAGRRASTNEVVTFINNYESTVNGEKSFETNSTQVTCGDVGVKPRVDISYDSYDTIDTTPKFDNVHEDCPLKQDKERPGSQNRYVCSKNTADTSSITANNTSHGDSFVSAKSCLSSLSQSGKDQITNKRKDIKTLSTKASRTLESTEEEFYDCPTPPEERTYRGRPGNREKSEKRSNCSQETMLETEIKLRYINEDMLGIQASHTELLMKKNVNSDERMSKKISGSTNDYRGKAHSGESIRRGKDESKQRVTFKNRTSQTESRENRDVITRQECNETDKGSHQHGGKIEQGCFYVQNGQKTNMEGASPSFRKSYRSPGKLTMKMHCDEYLPTKKSRSIKVQTNSNSIDALRSSSESEENTSNGSKERIRMCLQCKLRICQCNTTSRIIKSSAMLEDMNNYQILYQPLSGTDISTSEHTSWEKEPQCIEINRKTGITNINPNPCARPKEIKTNTTRANKDPGKMAAEKQIYCDKINQKVWKHPERRSEAHEIEPRKDKAKKDQNTSVPDSDSWSDFWELGDQILCSTCEKEETQQNKNIELIKCKEQTRKCKEVYPKSEELNKKSKKINNNEKPGKDAIKINKPRRKNNTPKPGRIVINIQKPSRGHWNKEESKSQERDKSNLETSKSRQSVFDRGNKRNRSESYRDRMRKQFNKINCLSCLQAKDSISSDDSNNTLQEKHILSKASVKVKAGNNEVYTISCSTFVDQISIEQTNSNDSEVKESQRQLERSIESQETAVSSSYEANEENQAEIMHRTDSGQTKYSHFDSDYLKIAGSKKWYHFCFKP